MVLDIGDVAAMEMMVSQQDKEIRTLEGRRSACEEVTEIADSLRDFRRRRTINNENWITFLQDQFKQNIDKIRKFSERTPLACSPPTTASASIQLPEEVLSPLTGDFEGPSTPPAPVVDSTSPRLRERQLAEREIWLDQKMAQVEEELRVEQAKLNRLLVCQSIPSFSELIQMDQPRQLIQAQVDSSFVSADSEEGRLTPYAKSARRVKAPRNDALRASVAALAASWAKWKGL